MAQKIVITPEDILNPAALLAQQQDVQEKARLRRVLWFCGAPARSMLDLKPAEITPLGTNMLMLHGAIAAEAEDLQRTLRLVDRALESDTDAFAAYGYAGLLVSVAPFRPDLLQRYEGLLDTLRHFRSQKGGFVQQARASQTLCVVGNAPSLLGARRGAFIDSHDMVIRFNNFSTGGIQSADTGTKTDVWARTTTLRGNDRREGARFAHVITSGVPAWWRSPAALSFANEAMLSGLAHDCIDPHSYFQVASHLGSKPSSGIALLGWLRVIRGSLAGVSIEGFNLSDQPDGGTTSYFATSPRTSEVPHDWAAERALLDRWRAEAAS